MVALILLCDFGGAQVFSRQPIVSWGARVVDGRAREATYIDVAAGGAHVLGVRPDGSATAWGTNYAGLSMPPDPTLAGALLHAQALLVEAGSTAAGLVLSDGATAVIGM